MNIEINFSQRNILISTIIMGWPGGKINMAAVSAKRSIVKVPFKVLMLGQFVAALVRSLTHWTREQYKTITMATSPKNNSTCILQGQ